MSYTIRIGIAEFTAPTMDEALEMARKWDERSKAPPLRGPDQFWQTPRDFRPIQHDPYSPPGLPPPWIVWCSTQ